MAKTIEIHQMDEELDKLVKEAEQWVNDIAEERKKKMAEVEDLYRGKTVEVNAETQQDLVNDQLHQRIIKLSLRDVLLFSGQGKPATHKEKLRLGLL